MAKYPPLWQQANSYPSQIDRSLLSALWPGGGASGAAPVAVANTMNVSIPPGSCAVPLQAGQGSALCHWDAAEVVAIGAAPPSGQSRVDLIVCQVRDNAVDGGPDNDFVFVAVAGSPAALAAETRPGDDDPGEIEPRAVAPAVPANAYAMCTVTVPGAAANLNAATITDRRTMLGNGAGVIAYKETTAVQSNIQQTGVVLGGISPLVATTDGSRLWRLKAAVQAFKNTGDIAAAVTTFIQGGPGMSTYLQWAEIYLPASSTSLIINERLIAPVAGTWSFQVLMNTGAGFVNVQGDNAALVTSFSIEDVGPNVGIVTAPPW